MADWTATCVLCAARDKTTRLETGHVCANCQSWLANGLRELLRLASEAWLFVEPASNGTAGSSAFGSKPPLNVEALDPELALIELNVGDRSSAVTILEMLEMWERAVRQDRGMAPYGLASHARARKLVGAVNDTGVTFTGCTGFLAAQVPWMCATPEFGIDEFADHIRRAVRILRRWDSEAQHLGSMVKCPTLTDTGECGYRLHYQDVHDEVTCKRCGTTRSAMTLAAVAMADGREVWLDPEAAAGWLGVSESTLQRMARRGQIQRSHGRYCVRHEWVSA